MKKRSILKTSFTGLLILALLIGCKSNNQQIGTDSGMKKPDSATESAVESIKVDLDTCKIEEIRESIVFYPHKGIDSTRTIDTFRLNSQIYSIKSLMYVEVFHGAEYYMSSLRVFHDTSLIFSIDSILTVGSMIHAKGQELLIVPIIRYQGADDFVSEGDLYLIDFNKGSANKIASNLINNSYAEFCESSNLIIYANSDKLIRYNLDDKLEKVLLDFDYPSMQIFKTKTTGNKLEIWYYKDFANDIIYDNPLLKAKVYLDIDICGL
jgi:hypothetical protein